LTSISTIQTSCLSQRQSARESPPSPGLGYEMVSAEFPAEGHLASMLTRGIQHLPQNKLSVFDPDAISETDFSVGRHQARPNGVVCYPACGP
jgi:hypothetical protein